ncbi:trimeric intracellular cation channel family protein [Dongshaea marina]|uniref:trimeric intracellular cation channel family protein n=1 Tax=Dongshaea marina TaxID=2047966 RepID=UPI000D3E02EC|nr:trimeric intracellular cation channel family protein [Dongshaea marina]
MVRFCDLFGTAVFAISGVLVAGRLRMDIFGVAVLATVTAIGGGTIRDSILGATPVFWVHDVAYLWDILITVFLCVWILWLVKIPGRLPWYLLPLADALGLAVFTVIGIQKALHFGSSELVAIIMGVITGVGGGMIRDVLARQIPMILQKEIYATACILGGIVYFICLKAGLSEVLTIWISIFGTLGIRVAAIFWHLSLPAFTMQRR